MYQYLKRKHHFCSNKCQSDYNHKLIFEDRTCEVCGEIYSVSHKSTQRFCSCDCQNKWQKSNTGLKNKKFQGKELACDNCGKMIMVGKYRLDRSSNYFCSDACRREWYSKKWSQSDEWREKSRNRAIQMLADGKLFTLTKPQIIVNNILDNIDIRYKNEERFGFYSVDNYLIDFNLIIEVMGDYWHSSPLRYVDNINDVQKKIANRDKSKHTYISRYYGIEILYLWEEDVIKFPDKCAALIEEYIRSAGILCNYNSFNYTFNCGVLSLNSNIIYTRYEKNAC
jgi:very-short-patch-repair endonuclease